MAEAKTRAAEAAVTVLLAASGVTAAVGIFEAQEHHSAIGWFTSCAATFIAAVLFPITVFIFFPWIEGLDGKSAKKEIQHSSEKNISSPSGHYMQEKRIIIASTPKALFQDRQRYGTMVEADAAMQRYIGKWIEVCGWLDDMYLIGSNKDELAINIDSENNLPKGLISQYFGVTLHFSDKETIDWLTTLNRGDPIAALGQIDKIARRDITLRNCELSNTTTGSKGNTLAFDTQTTAQQTAGETITESARDTQFTPLVAAFAAAMDAAREAGMRDAREAAKKNDE